MPKWKLTSLMSLCLVFMLAPLGNANQWQKINDPDALAKIYNNTVLVGVQWPRQQYDLNKIPTDWQIEYCQDGSGRLTFWGEVTPRSWRIKGRNQVCITTDYGEKCYFFEQHSIYGKLYRSGLAGSKIAPWVFKISDRQPAICENL